MVKCALLFNLIMTLLKGYRNLKQTLTSHAIKLVGKNLTVDKRPHKVSGTPIKFKGGTGGSEPPTSRTIYTQIPVFSI